MAKSGVSVLMPVYNTDPRQLRVAVASVFAQKFTDATGAPFEIIVVDDGSTNPATRRQVQRLADEQHPSMRVHFHEANQGQGVALNTALKAAQYRTILPLDPDDILLSPNISKIGKGFMQQGFEKLDIDPTIDLVTCHLLNFGAGTAKQPQIAYSSKRILYRNMIPNYAMYHRQEILDAGGYNPAIRAPADWAMWLRLLNHRQMQGRDMNVVQLPEALYGYRQHPDARNLSAIYNTDHRQITQRMINHVPDLYSRAFPLVPIQSMPSLLYKRLRLSYYWSRVNDIRSAESPMGEVGAIIGRKLAHIGIGNRGSRGALEPN